MTPQAWGLDLLKPQGDKGLTLQQRLTDPCPDNQCSFSGVRITLWPLEEASHMLYGNMSLNLMDFSFSSHQELFRMQKCCGPSAKESVFGMGSRHLLLGCLCPCGRCLVTFHCPLQSPVESGVASFSIKFSSHIFPEHIPMHTGHTLNACHRGLVSVPSFSQGKDNWLLIMC